jgi:hypothetical protein
VVSTAIVVERQEDGHAYPVQRPVYFGSGSSTYCLTWSVGRRLLVQASTFPLAVTRLEHAAR